MPESAPFFFLRGPSAYEAKRPPLELIAVMRGQGAGTSQVFGIANHFVGQAQL